MTDAGSAGATAGERSTAAVHYREAIAGDVDAIAALHADSWRRTYRGLYADEYLDGGLVDERLAVWRDRFATPAPNQWTLLAVDDGDGSLAGFVHLYRDDDDRWGSLVDNLHVVHTRRREGTGGRLMVAAGAHVHDHAARSAMYLWVLEQNANARRFYAGLGGDEVEAGEWEPPGGGLVRSRRCAWTDLAAFVGRR